MKRIALLIPGILALALFGTSNTYAGEVNACHGHEELCTQVCSSVNPACTVGRTTYGCLSGFHPGVTSKPEEGWEFYGLVYDPVADVTHGIFHFVDPLGEQLPTIGTGSIECLDP